VCETVLPVTILLVRHARAGRRDRWVGDDRLRPLSRKGRVQADALPATVAGLLGGAPARLVSSPWVRCVETLTPLSAAIGAAVAIDEALGEGMGDKAVEAVGEWMAGSTVLCTHGDVVERILLEVAAHGVRLGRPVQASKGSLWVLSGSCGRVEAARYLPPPA
jgi:phosphohistidine phosphatase SixA